MPSKSKKKKKKSFDWDVGVYIPSHSYFKAQQRYSHEAPAKTLDISSFQTHILK